MEFCKKSERFFRMYGYGYFKSLSQGFCRSDLMLLASYMIWEKNDSMKEHITKTMKNLVLRTRPSFSSKQKMEEF